MGLLDRLFGRGEDPADRSDFDRDGQICARCNKPIARENLALDSGGGQPVHRVCPPDEGPAKE